MIYLAESGRGIIKGFLFNIAPRGEEYNLEDLPASPGITSTR
jgi:hypothetical protein